MLDLTHDDSDFFQEIEAEPESPHSDLNPTRRGGGPRTPHGKENSSKNGVTHGCRSHILILADEKQEDFDALYQRWEDAYQPDSEAALELLEQFVINKWYLERNERRFNQVEFQLSHFPYTKWDEGQHKIYQLTLRYKTAADRAASKAQRDLEDFLKNRRAEEKYSHKLSEINRDILKEGEECMISREDSMLESIVDAEKKGLDMTAQRAELAEIKKQNRATLGKMRQEMAVLDAHKTRAELLFQGQNSPKKLRKIPFLDQWVEIKVKDGVTLTELTPSNEKLIQRGQTMFPPPEMVYRRLNFPHGIPEEYDWTTDDPLMKQYGGFGTQRMTVNRWLDVIDAEKLRSDGHIGPCGDPQPRPQQHGGCDCPACQLNYERLAARANPKPQV